MTEPHSLMSRISFSSCYDAVVVLLSLADAQQRYYLCFYDVLKFKRIAATQTAFGCNGRWHCFEIESPLTVLLDWTASDQAERTCHY